MMGTRLLGAIGIGFSLAAVVGIASRMVSENEEVQSAVSEVRDEWNSWRQEISETFDITRRLTHFAVVGLRRVLNVMRRLKDGFVRLSDRVGGVDRLMRLLAISAGTLFVALNAGKILAFFRQFGRSIARIKLKVLAMVAVIILIALLIEDFINFMQGNDSLMGSLFEKFGVDGGKVRETVFSIMDALRSLIPLILDLAMMIGGKLLEVIMLLVPILIEVAAKIIPVLIGIIQELIPIIAEIIMEILPVLLDILKTVLPFIVQIIKEVLPIIVDLIKQLLPLVMEIIRAVLPAILSLIQRLVPIIMRFVETLLPMLIGFIEQLVPMIMRIVETVLPMIIRLIETLIPIIMQIIEAVLPIIINLIEMLLPMVMQIIETVLPMIINLIDMFISTILPIVDAILPVLMSLLEALMPIITFVAELIGKVLAAAFEGLMPIIDAFMGILQGLMNFISSVFAGDWAAAWEAVRSIFSNIVSGLAAIFKLPINLIISGLNTFIGGLNKLQIPSWVPGVGGKGINIPLIPMLAKGSDSSPDTFIAGEEGPELITNAKGSKVFTADETVGIFQTLKDIASLSAKPNAETSAAMYSSVEYTNIVQHVEISNAFHGDRAGQEKSANAMEKAADNATDELARALAYVRG